MLLHAGFGIEILAPISYKNMRQGHPTEFVYFIREKMYYKTLSLSVLIGQIKDK
jgi:hypothetical protein